MLAIKLKRVGKKHQASFRIIIAEKRSKLDGRYVEDVGWLNPRTNEFNVKNERVEYWLKNGAQPTDTVHNLLVKAGLFKGPKKAVHAKAKQKKAPGEPAEEKQPEQKQEKEEAVKDEKNEAQQAESEKQAEAPVPVEQKEQPGLTEEK